jgi:hypothetical protein
MLIPLAVTWNPEVYPLNSSMTVKLHYANNSDEEAWSSKEADISDGFTTVTMDKAWMQGYARYNLTFFGVVFERNDPKKKSTPYKGPTITLTNQPPRHYDPPPPTKSPNKMGLMIGLPVSLGFVAIVVFGLWFGMRKQRTIGLGNVMGRKRGYGTGKSRRQRLGLGKKGGIRLDQDLPPPAQYHDNTHTRGDSLGSLVSDDEIRPAPGGNHFRDEINRQHTGRM